VTRSALALHKTETIPGAFCLAKLLRITDPRTVYFGRRRSSPGEFNRYFGPPSPVSSPPGEDFTPSHSRFIPPSVRAIPAKVFPKTRGAFLLLFGEKAMMREDVKQIPRWRAIHFRRRRSSAGFRLPCHTVEITACGIVFQCRR
jgi:hypothetical protein